MEKKQEEASKAAKQEEKKSNNWPTLLATLITGQVLTGMGLNVALHSILVVQVPQDTNRFMADNQLNWAIASCPLGAMAGCMLAMPVAPVLGARRLLMFSQPLYALASLVVALGQSFPLVLLGRLVMFIMLGMSETTVRGYVSEIVPPNRRTLYTAILNTMVFASQAIGLLIAQYVHWTTFHIGAGFLPAGICLAGLYFIHNSPKWLLSHGHSEEEALRAIRFFHGTEADADSEVRNIQDSLRHMDVDGVSLPLWKLILQRETLMPLLLAFGQLVIFIWSGGIGINYITSYILQPVNLPLNDYQSAMLPLAVAAIFSVPTSFVIERFGRLPLLRVSGSLSGLGCATIAVFFYLPEALQQTLGWVVLVGATLTQYSFACIIAPIALTYVNELLPNRTRTFCANILMGMMNTMLFMFVKTFSPLTELIGFGGVFLLHMAVSGLQVVYATFCLPETKGLSLERIQHLFQKVEKVAEAPLHVGDTEQGNNGKDNPALNVAPSEWA
ncbi:sugar transporter ERD6-like 7 [Pollicipes pollicipes]|uniref:sugar transporter ERD6-like 7 n=1 Tax=Pollicipes pollicipes TaxID=41117 RepID=UPI001884CB77|nr:sugar transporter ERD6-like 7 [Pollicipes pollicipes]